MAGNYHSPIDLTDSPQKKVPPGVVSPTAARVYVSAQDEAAVQRSREAAQRQRLAQEHANRKQRIQAQLEAQRKAEEALKRQHVRLVEERREELEAQRQAQVRQVQEAQRQAQVRQVQEAQRQAQKRQMQVEAEREVQEAQRQAQLKELQVHFQRQVQVRREQVDARRQAQERQIEAQRQAQEEVNRRQNEAVLANQQRQEVLRQQQIQEWERRRQRVAEDVERRRQETMRGGAQQGGHQRERFHQPHRHNNHRAHPAEANLEGDQTRSHKRARHHDAGPEIAGETVSLAPQVHAERPVRSPYLPEEAGPSGPANAGSQEVTLAGALDTLANLFTDIDLAAAGAALTACAAQNNLPLGRALEFLTNQYFDKGDWPKRERQNAAEAPPKDGAAGASLQEEKDVFSLGPPPEHCKESYYKWAVYQLQMDFPRVSLTDIRKCLKFHQERYAPAYKAVLTEMQKIVTNSAAGKGKAPMVESTHDSKVAFWAPNFKMLQKPRPKPRHVPEESCIEFEEELQAVKRATMKDQEVEDMLLAEKLNEEEYAGEGQEIECGCCCGEYPFEKMVQCAEGHLFCFACLKRRVEESTFGAASAGGSLPCMDTDGCQAEFPYAEVRRALPEATLKKYEDRQFEQSLMSAELNNLVRCPFCEYACEVDEGNRVLECPKCNKASCRECKEASHIPLKCSEVEKKGETAFRTKVEELMTKALVRECNKCRTEVIKDAGCNKVTCRCGQTMCYVCRAAIKPDYTHFCQHFRGEPNKKCTQCSKCNLYTTGDDAEEVKRVRVKAIEEAAHLDPEAAKRMIGAPDDLPQAQRRVPLPFGHLPAGLVF